MTIDLILHNPNLLPRDQVRLERVAATPYPDRRRVKVEIDITPFREQPNLEISIRRDDGLLTASSSVVAVMHFKVAFNLHLRGMDDPAGTYTVRVQLYYDEAAAPQDSRDADLIVPAPTQE
jgi:hypothetical protein